MKKMKIAFFGISDDIYKAIKGEINPRNAEIVLFFDNDESKHGICYANIPIKAPSMQLFEDYSVDYILVTALSAYEAVKEQLIGLGIPKDKIQVFVPEGIQQYCLGSISDIDTELIRNIYFDPQKTLDIVADYEKIYTEYSFYSSLPAYEEVDGWFNKSRLISHACGGVVNGRASMYSNSKEAFQYTAAKKFKLMECDLLQMYNGELLLVHDYGRFYEAEQGQYSMLSAEELLRLLKEHKEISCLIDVKWKDYDEYAFLVNQIDGLIEKIADNSNEKEILKRQIVMEVYDEETIKIAKENNFDIIFTQYRNPRRSYFMNTVSLCYKYGVRVIAIAVDECLEMSKFIKIITDKNIKIFAFSTDSIEEYSTLRKMNVTGVFTNYLTESDITGS